MFLILQELSRYL